MNQILSSKKRRLTALLLTSFLLSTNGFSQPELPSLVLHAYLFYNKTGQLSKDILAKDGPALGNTVTDSTSTFVVVEVKPQNGQSMPSNTQIRLMATEGGNSAMVSDTKRPPHPNKIILDKVSRIGPSSDTGVTHVGFWLADTGCASVTLKASIVGAKTAPQTAVLGFACYE